VYGVAVTAALLAIVGSILMITLGRVARIDPVQVIAILGLAMFASWFMPRLRIGGSRHGPSITDFTIIFGLTLLPGPWMILTIAVATVIGKTVARFPAGRIVANTAKDVVTVFVAASAGWLCELGSPFETPGATFGRIVIVALIALATDEAIAVPMIALANGQRSRDVWAAYAPFRLVMAMIRMGCGIAAGYLVNPDPRMALALPVLAIALHLAYANRLQQRVDRLAWARLSQLVDAVSTGEPQTVRLAAVHGTAELFACAEVDLVLRTRSETDVMLRGDSRIITYVGPAAAAPERPGAVIVAPLGPTDPRITASPPADGDSVGELRLRFLAPVAFTEQERHTLQALAAALATALRKSVAVSAAERMATTQARAATHDRLTGLANRGYLLAHGLAEVGRQIAAAPVASAAGAGAARGSAAAGRAAAAGAAPAAGASATAAAAAAADRTIEPGHTGHALPTQRDGVGPLNPAAESQAMRAPGVSHQAASDPDAADPGISAPGISAPAALDPGPADPGVSDPGVSDPGVSAPAALGPASDPGPSEPAALDPVLDPASDLADPVESASRVQRAGLAVIDLIGFKQINDALGQSVGDEVLISVGERLADLAGPSELVARVSGDEFAVLLTSIDSTADAIVRTRDLLAAIAQPLTVDGVRLDIAATAGVAVNIVDGDLGELLRRADVAVEQAKLDGLAVAAYAPARDTADVGRLALGADLTRAVAHREFTIAFQPVVDLETGMMRSAEALARWPHPRLGQLSPHQFLDGIERSGLLTGFTEHILDQALAGARMWTDAGFEAPVAVNVSPRSLLDAGFPHLISVALDRYHLPPSALIIELTETLTLSSLGVVDEVLHTLRELGVMLALDDFGTGYSSLATVARVPIDELKIDRSFVAGIAGATENAIVRTTIELGRSLDILVVAEGIESAEQRERLWSLGCDAGQGHLFSRPVPAQRLIARLRRGHEGVPGRFVAPMHGGEVIRLPSSRRPADVWRNELN
jgi:diguanylate cyclase (GGDEF)-like protein